jgi:hypothetical protein
MSYFFCLLSWWWQQLAAARELERQRARIEELRQQIEALQGTRILPRQPSSEQLPPIH